jgi:hypothetical protein
MATQSIGPPPPGPAIKESAQSWITTFGVPTPIPNICVRARRSQSRSKRRHLSIGASTVGKPSGTSIRAIRGIAIAPGAVKTPINANVWQDLKGLSDLDEKIPMGRIGEPDEIGHVIAFLCSDLASYITGITVAVDGGMLLYPDFRHGG